MATAADPFGVYLHIPFCASKCDYCAFATWTDRHHLTDAYLDAVRTEIGRAVAGGMPDGTSVFVGGGTPSMVGGRELAAVIAAVPMLPDAEVTVECNPDDVTHRSARATTWTPASTGSASVCSRWRRTCSVPSGAVTISATCVRAVEAIGEVGLATFNLDVIYGAAGESVADWEHTVRSIIALDPPHVSAYGLTVEAGTPLAEQPDRHPDDDDQADKYELVDDTAPRGGTRELRDLQLGAPGARVPPQPPLLAPAGLPRFRVRRALASRRSPVVERPHPRPLHRARGCRRSRPRRPARRSTCRPDGSSGWNCSCECATACRSMRSTVTTCPVWSSVTMTGGC